MIRFHPAGAAALAFLIALSVCRGESEMPVPRREVEQLVGRGHEYLNEEEYSAWQQEVASRPDIKPDLLALLRRAYETDKDLDVGMALAALQLRTDLTEAELKEILMPLVSCRDAAALDRLHLSYAYAGLQVLKNYPSKEHEELAIAYLSRPEPAARLGAARALSQIGTERSLAGMRRLAEDLKPPEGLSNDSYDIVLREISVIEGRLPKAAGGAATRPRDVTVLPKFAWIGICTAAFFVLVLFILLLKRGGRKPGAQ